MPPLLQQVGPWAKFGRLFCVRSPHLRATFKFLDLLASPIYSFTADFQAYTHTVWVTGRRQGILYNVRSGFERTYFFEAQAHRKRAQQCWHRNMVHHRETEKHTE